VRPSPTVREACEAYLAWFKGARKSERETKNVIDVHILPTLGDLDIARLSAKQIRDWHHKIANKAARKRSGIAKRPAFREMPITEDEKRARRATANRILTVLKAVLNKTFHDDLVPSSDAWDKVRPFSGADQPVIRFLTEAEAIRLINACPPDLRQLVRGALLTGARYGELTSLEVGHVDLDTGTVFIAPGKSGKGRHLPLNSEGRRLFASLTAGKKLEDRVFLKTNGEAWGVNHQVRPLDQACRAASIAPGIRFHELRHTYASLLAQAGAGLLTISKLLGHADTRVTARHYAHLCDKTLANTVSTLLPGFGDNSDGKVKAIR